MTSSWPPEPNLDLGHDHKLTWVAAGQDDDTHVGAVIWHRPGPNGIDHAIDGWCAGGIQWADNVFEREHPDRLTESERKRPRWTLEGAADDHLTISPSVLCSCGDHGWIKNGQWQPA